MEKIFKIILESYNEEGWNDSENIDMSNIMSAEIIKRNMDNSNKIIYLQRIFDFFQRDKNILRSYYQTRHFMPIDIDSVISYICDTIAKDTGLSLDQVSSIFSIECCSDFESSNVYAEKNIIFAEFPGGYDNISWFIDYLKYINVAKPKETADDVVYKILTGFIPIDKTIGTKNEYLENISESDLAILRPFYKEKWNEFSNNDSNITSFDISIDWDLYKEVPNGSEYVGQLEVIQIKNTGILMKFPALRMDLAPSISWQPSVIEFGSFITFIPYCSISMNDIAQMLS